ncbi:hypothetical protein ANN_10943 [Periplaneta americana]|uniref:Uncharacterized protein n=1 Tax=Periplaneta americana TaxID=6978 RepID=A0ABQ8T567_PERAM|nr:hypothetical protein ANN_10943 [Periplaneta americana]
MAGLCEGGNGPVDSLKAICKMTSQFKLIHDLIMDDYIQKTATQPTAVDSELHLVLRDDQMAVRQPWRERDSRDFAARSDSLASNLRQPPPSHSLESNSVPFVFVSDLRVAYVSLETVYESSKFKCYNINTPITSSTRYSMDFFIGSVAIGLKACCDYRPDFVMSAVTKSFAKWASTQDMSQSFNLTVASPPVIIVLSSAWNSAYRSNITGHLQRISPLELE